MPKQPFRIVRVTPPAIDIDDILHPDERRRRTVRLCEASIAVLDQRMERIDEELERLASAGQEDWRRLVHLDEGAIVAGEVAGG